MRILMLLYVYLKRSNPKLDSDLAFVMELFVTW